MPHYSCFVSPSPTSTSFMVANMIWRTKVPCKVRAFVWLVILGKLNTLEYLRTYRSNKSLNPHRCIICLKDGVNNDHLFKPCSLAKCLWTRFFKIGGEEWVAPRRIGNFLFTNFRGFGGYFDLKKL